ncbi:MAG: 30S ribosomal protein S16 [Simkaniaceae bacterium]|nr:30S ribosomal protein S16 [Simkaniaceae bacterium]MCF7852957.1 30S ribosomal protein S16 [Simkaniaceae bacterium]
MALKIRLRQQGRTNHRLYRLVVADSRLPRDGKYIEKIGLYDPHRKGEEDTVINHERLAFWIEQGAELTEKTVSLIARGAPEVYKNWLNKQLDKRKKLLDKRKARKAKAAAA